MQPTRALLVARIGLAVAASAMLAGSPAYAQSWPSVLPPPWVSPAEPAAPFPEPSFRPSDEDDGVGGFYPLDPIPRETSGSGSLRCPEVELVGYRGEVVPLRGGARVHPAFREKIRRLEAIVRDTAIEIYGRAPTGMRLMGTYTCRRIRRIDGLISEHAFGNAIDVSGFDFARAPAGSSAPSGDPRLSRAFRVTVARHWNATNGQSVDAVHSRFLRRLIANVLGAPSLFRVVIGPADPDHWNHFHFDSAPYHYVRI